MSKLIRDFAIAEDHAFTNSQARRALQDIKDALLDLIKVSTELNTELLNEVELTDSQSQIRLKFQRTLELLSK